MIILLDNGHGNNTAGKRSPDGLFREYKYTRLIANRIALELQDKGYDARILVPEEFDVALSVRCKRANQVCSKYGKQNVILVSIHVDAAGADGQWHNATGWSVYTSRGQTRADKLADELYATAEVVLSGKKIRKDLSDGDPDYEAGFYILKNTACPAVLTENFFQDTKTDVSWLLSIDGQNAITKLHVDGIINYIKKYGK